MWMICYPVRFDCSIAQLNPACPCPDIFCASSFPARHTIPRIVANSVSPDLNLWTLLYMRLSFKSLHSQQYNEFSESNFTHVYSAACTLCSDFFTNEGCLLFSQTVFKELLIITEGSINLKPLGLRAKCTPPSDKTHSSFYLLLVTT